MEMIILLKQSQVGNWTEMKITFKLGLSNFQSNLATWMFSEEHPKNGTMCPFLLYHK